MRYNCSLLWGIFKCTPGFAHQFKSNQIDCIDPKSGWFQQIFPCSVFPPFLQPFHSTYMVFFFITILFLQQSSTAFLFVSNYCLWQRNHTRWSWTQFHTYKIYSNLFKYRRFCMHSIHSHSQITQTLMVKLLYCFNIPLE